MYNLTARLWRNTWRTLWSFRLLAGALLPGLFFWTACDKDDTGSDINGIDRHFVIQAALINRGEAVLGQLAMDTSTDMNITAYAQQMATDHIQANADLQSIAGPVPTDSLDLRHRALLGQLKGLSGRAFDSTYILNMVYLHEEAIMLFNRQMAGGKNLALQDYAASRLSVLRTHLRQAQNLAAAY